MSANLVYAPKYHIDWAWSLAINGATDAEVAKAFGVTRKTIIAWRKKYTEFNEAMEGGKAVADARIVKSLYERACGYDYEEEEQVIDVHKDGTSKIGRIVKRKKKVPADVMAQMYWLNNRHRKTGEWSQRQEVVTTTEDVKVTLYIPDNGRDQDECRG
jgi:transposase-like protein